MTTTNSKIETITCPCGESFEWNNPYANESEPFRSLGRPTTCPACQAIEDERLREINKANGDRIAAEWLESLRLKAINSMPPLFQATDINHPKFNRRAWDKIKSWEPSPETPWIGLTGSTGGCKSRIAYLYAVEEFLRMAKPRVPRSTSETNEPGRAPRYVFTPSYEIAEAVLAQYGGKQDASRSLYDDRSPAQRARSWLDRLRDVDLLLIDDLGKGKLSAAVASEMFALIDHRHVNQMVTIWTSNSTPEVIAACMPEDMGAPFAGRINESSKTFQFK